MWYQWGTEQAYCLTYCHLQYGPLTASLRFPKDRENPLEPTLTKIAERLSKDVGEKLDNHAVTLLWVKAKGGVAVTSSANPENIKGLAKTAKLQVSLTPEEVAEIDRIGSQYHFRYYVSGCLRVLGVLLLTRPLSE